MRHFLLPRLTLTLLLAPLAMLTAQPAASPGAPWGATTAEWKARRAAVGETHLQQALEPNGDTTLVYPLKTIGSMLVRFDADGLFSIRNLVLVDVADAATARGAYDLTRASLAEQTGGACTFSETTSSDSTKRQARLACADSLTTIARIENATKNGTPCVAFTIEVIEGDNVRDRRRRK